MIFSASLSLRFFDDHMNFRQFAIHIFGLKIFGRDMSLHIFSPVAKWKDRRLEHPLHFKTIVSMPPSSPPLSFDISVHYLIAMSQERSMEFIVTGKIQWESLPPGISESAKRFAISLTQVALTLHAIYGQLTAIHICRSVLCLAVLCCYVLLCAVPLGSRANLNSLSQE